MRFDRWEISERYGEVKGKLHSGDSPMLWFGILVLAAVIFAHPFFRFEYMQMGDTPFHLSRIEGIKESILTLEIPMRINGYSLNGYGTADGIMYPDLLLYFPAILRLFDMPVGLSYNLLWIAATFLNVFAGWLGFTLWGGSLRHGAVMSLLYSSGIPLMHVYGKAPGDYVAFGGIPLVLGALMAILSRPRGWIHWPWLVVGFTIIAQSHVITTLFICIMVVVLIVYYHRSLEDIERKYAIFKVAVFCFLLNAWRLFPLLYFYRHVHFKIFSQLGITFYNTTSSLPALFKSQFYIGYPLIFLGIACMFMPAARRNVSWLAVCAFNALLLLMIWNKFPWSIIDGEQLVLSRKIQTPLRFLVVGFPFLCRYVGQFVVDYISKYSRNIIPACIGLLCCFWGIYSALNWTFYYSSLSFSGIGVYKTLDSVPSVGFQEDYLYDDVSLKKMRSKDGGLPTAKDFYSSADIYDINKHGTVVDFSYNTKKDAIVRVPLFYWPGYSAFDNNGDKLRVSEGKDHVMEVLLPAGTGTVHINYTGLWYFKLFDWLFLVSAVVFIVVLKRQVRAAIYQ